MYSIFIIGVNWILNGLVTYSTVYAEQLFVYIIVHHRVVRGSWCEIVYTDDA